MAENTSPPSAGAAMYYKATRRHQTWLVIRKCTQKSIKILFRKKWRGDWGQEMLAIIRCRIFCLPGCYPKI